MDVGMIIVIVIAVLLVILIIALIGTYNSLVKLRNTVEEGFATMDVYLKKRFDLIPNLVETVKGYAAHEASTLEKVIAARSAVKTATTTGERLKKENILTDTLRSLFAVSEQYPDLKANQNFMDLQQQLNRVEEDIANSRKYYNGVVKMFNNKCEIFPSNLVAGIFRFERKPMYQVDDQAERHNVKVEF